MTFFYDNNTKRDTVDGFVMPMIMYICGKQKLSLANGQEYSVGTICRLKDSEMTINTLY